VITHPECGNDFNGILSLFIGLGWEIKFFYAKLEMIEFFTQNLNNFQKKIHKLIKNSVKTHKK
jgi:hypothetical protein